MNTVKSIYKVQINYLIISVFLFFKLEKVICPTIEINQIISINLMNKCLYISVKSMIMSRRISNGTILKRDVSASKV